MPSWKRRLLLPITLAATASAFVPVVHVAITEKAMWNVSSDLRLSPQAKQTLGDKWFTEQAVKEVGDANTATDQGNCAPDKADIPTQPCGTIQGVYDLKADATFPGDHFDNELFEASNNQLIRLRRELLALLAQQRFVAARKVLGKMLHAIQDFYSHSNWVEMNIDRIDDRIAKRSFVGTWPRLPKPTEKVCDAPGTLSRTVQGDETLTSGYYPNNHASVLSRGKCAHGDGLDKTSGISKDLHADDLKIPDHLPRSVMIVLQSARDKYRYDMARYLAFEHSKKFIQELVEDPALQASPQALLGLLGHEETACQCPDALTEHVDRPGWIDVSARKVRRSDVVVKEGDLVDFQGTGLISWGTQFGFFGPELHVGPEGGQDPGNRIQVTPPMPRFPIGMLYAAIYDEKEIHGALHDAAGIPLNHGGTQVRPRDLIAIGKRTRMKMRAGGRVYFGVNDGNLSNNKGCFQVKATIEWRQ